MGMIIFGSRETAILYASPGASKSLLPTGTNKTSGDSICSYTSEFSLLVDIAPRKQIDIPSIDSEYIVLIYFLPPSVVSLSMPFIKISLTS